LAKKLWSALQRLAECEIGKGQNEKLLSRLGDGWVKFAVVASQSAIQQPAKFIISQEDFTKY